MSFSVWAVSGRTEIRVRECRLNEADQAESFRCAQRLPELVRRLTLSHNAIGLHPAKRRACLSRDYLIEIILKAEFDILRASGLRFFRKLPTVRGDRREAINRFSATERDFRAARILCPDPPFGALHAQ